MQSALLSERSKCCRWIRRLTGSHRSIHAVLVVGIVLAATRAEAAAFTFKSYNVPGATQTHIYAINNSGAFVGRFETGGAYSSYSDPRQYPRNHRDPGAGAGLTFVAGINDLGDVVGEWSVDTSSFHAFIRSADGQYTTLPAIPGTTSMSANGINNLGDIVGGSDAGGFLFHDGLSECTRFGHATSTMRDSWWALRARALLASSSPAFHLRRPSVSPRRTAELLLALQSTQMGVWPVSRSPLSGVCSVSYASSMEASPSSPILDTETSPPSPILEMTPRMRRVSTTRESSLAPTPTTRVQI